MINNNCDCGGPCYPLNNEVRVLPTGRDSNAILCRAGFNREMMYRRARNMELAKENQFDLPIWNDLEIYSNS